jgi:hypothetical protein
MTVAGLRPSLMSNAGGNAATAKDGTKSGLVCAGTETVTEIDHTIKIPNT